MGEPKFKEPTSKDIKNVDESIDEAKEDGKTKRYSDKRKEERLKREKEKAEKMRKEEGIITIEDDSSRDDVTEGTSFAAEIVTIDTADESSADTEKKEEKNK